MFIKASATKTLRDVMVTIYFIMSYHNFTFLLSSHENSSTDHIFTWWASVNNIFASVCHTGNPATQATWRIDQFTLTRLIDLKSIIFSLPNFLKCVFLFVTPLPRFLQLKGLPGIFKLNIWQGSPSKYFW